MWTRGNLYAEKWWAEHGDSLISHGEGGAEIDGDDEGGGVGKIDANKDKIFYCGIFVQDLVILEQFHWKPNLRD